LVEFCVEKYGGLDILVLNAGVNAHFSFPSLTNFQILDQLMQTNYHANVYLTKHALQHLQNSKGQIVVISSMSGKIGTPSRSAYCASKFATSGFFEALRTEDLGVDITVVYPPSLRTPMREHDLLRKEGEEGHGEDGAEEKEKREDPREAAKVIVMAADHRVENFYFPLKPYLAAYLSPIFP
jgi:NAD(P)-dependent dehydrogenase (short-subunit alcohol dehydrogenase family)